MRTTRSLETKGKDSAITLRISKEQKNILAQAAKLRHTSLTSFVLQQAFYAAQDTLSDQVRFSLGDQQWDLFCETLDKPARPIEEIKNLLEEKTVLDE